jgi:polar amino acid transport system substrate-binding protein
MSRRDAAGIALGISAVLGAVLVLAGCSSSTPSIPPAAAVTSPSEASASTAPAGTAASAAQPVPSCDATASLRPAATLPSPGAMPPDSFMAKIAARGRLVVGTSQDTLLFSSRNPFTGTIEGFDIDIAHQIAQAIFGDPNRLQLVVIPNSDRIPDVQAGTVDLVAETMTINCERDKLVDFSSVYYDAGQRILVLASSKATSLADLGGQKVCAAAGSTSLDAIRAAPGHPVAVSKATWGDCLVAFQQNEVQAISTDDTILAGLAAQDPYAKVAGPRFTSEPYGLAIDKSHPEFTRFVNGVLARDRADGTWAKIYGRWLTKLASTPAPPVAHYRN